MTMGALLDILCFLPRALGIGIGPAWCMSMPWHHWRIVRPVSDQANKMQCECCGRFWANNHRMQIVLPWDEDFAEFYARRERKRFGRAIVD
jgi:hypothetical protein